MAGKAAFYERIAFPQEREPTPHTTESSLLLLAVMNYDSKQAAGQLMPQGGDGSLRDQQCGRQ